MRGLVIRQASKADAPSIGVLLGELGYPQRAGFVEDKISLLARQEDDSTLVAELDGEIVGVAHLHVAPVLHESGHLGRVTALVVTRDRRHMGIGKALMSSLDTAARQAGCTKMEITSGTQRDGAHEFYKHLGYCQKPKRFLKSLRDGY